MWNQKPSFRFEIDNFSEKEVPVASQTFVSGGYEWSLYLYPKGHSRCTDHLSLFLSAANYKSLQTGWKRDAKFYFSLLNQSDKELYRSPLGQGRPFCAQNPSLGFDKILPFIKFQEIGFLENDRLIIEVYIKIVQAVDGEGEDVSKKKEIVDITGCQDYASQVTLVRKIFAEHLEIAEEFKPKIQVVKKEYMDILKNACSKFSELVEVGVKLDWLKSKLGEVSYKKADDADGSRVVQQLEERIKNLELMVTSDKMDCLKSKLEESFLERKKSVDAEGSRVQQLEERIENLELMENSLRLDSLKSKLEKISLENKNADADRSQVQQLEDRVNNLELMVSDLKIELDEEKAKSSTDGFLLVEEVV